MYFRTTSCHCANFKTQDYLRNSFASFISCRKRNAPLVIFPLFSCPLLFGTNSSHLAGFWYLRSFLSTKRLLQHNSTSFLVSRCPRSSWYCRVSEVTYHRGVRDHTPDTGPGHYHDFLPMTSGTYYASCRTRCPSWLSQGTITWSKNLTLPANLPFLQDWSLQRLGNLQGEMWKAFIPLKPLPLSRAIYYPYYSTRIYTCSLSNVAFSNPTRIFFFTLFVPHNSWVMTHHGT